MVTDSSLAHTSLSRSSYLFSHVLAGYRRPVANLGKCSNRVQSEHSYVSSIGRDDRQGVPVSACPIIEG